MNTRRDLSDIAVLTGSRAFGCNQPDSDVDWLIHYNNFKSIYPDSGTLDLHWYGDGFACWRDGTHNFIVFYEEKDRRNWMTAHDYCLAHPEELENRIQIFRYFCGQDSTWKP